MSTLNDKLLMAYDNNDVVKMKKYLSNGADPHVNNSTLFFETILENKPNILHVLVSHDLSKKNMRQIVRYACLNNKTTCVKILLNFIDLNEYKQTDTIDYVNTLIGVC